MLAAKVELRRWAATRRGQQARGCDVNPWKKQLKPCFLLMAHRACHDAGRRRDDGGKRGAETQSGDATWSASVERQCWAATRRGPRATTWDGDATLAVSVRQHEVDNKRGAATWTLGRSSWNPASL